MGIEVLHHINVICMVIHPPSTCGYIRLMLGNFTYFLVVLSRMVQFPSRYYFDNAIRVIGRKGRLYRLERVDRSQWDLLVPYDGKAVILEGIPRNASVDEVERFLSGYGYDGSSFQMFVRQAFPEPIKVAIARLPSQTHAMNIFIMKNRGFILNNRISVRVLQ